VTTKLVKFAFFCFGGSDNLTFFSGGPSASSSLGWGSCGLLAGVNVSNTPPASNYLDNMTAHNSLQQVHQASSM
jgi:hypothetical protein